MWGVYFVITSSAAAAAVLHFCMFVQPLLAGEMAQTLMVVGAEKALNVAHPCYYLPGQIQ